MTKKSDLGKPATPAPPHCTFTQGHEPTPAEFSTRCSIAAYMWGNNA